MLHTISVAYCVKTTRHANNSESIIFLNFQNQLVCVKIVYSQIYQIFPVLLTVLTINFIGSESKK